MLSMGGNILLHRATLQPERIEAVVVVSATMYFPEQARDYAAGSGEECAAERTGNDAAAA
jgi:pimeloyl-ACP methyl ester carboxylesterase